MPENIGDLKAEAGKLEKELEAIGASNADATKKIEEAMAALARAEGSSSSGVESQSTPASEPEPPATNPETPTPEAETPPKEVVEGEVGNEVEAAVKFAKPDKKAKEGAMGKVADAIGETSGVDLRTGRRAESRNEAFARAEAEREAAKGKKEEAPTPQEDKDFKDKIKDLLPEGFDKLTEAQQLLVTRNIQARIVDIVRERGQIQYSDDLKNKKSWAKFRSLFAIKELGVKKAETRVFEDLLGSAEGKALIKADLERLSIQATGREVILNRRTGKPEILFIDPNSYEGMSRELASEFNAAANKFREMPYEWGQEKSGKNKKEYERARTEYEAAKDRMVKLDARKMGEEGAAVKILKLDGEIKFDQLLYTHPEIEREFAALSEASAVKESAKGIKRIAAGGGGQYSFIAGTGIVARQLAAAAGVMGAGTTAGIGAVLGAWRGKVTAEKELGRRTKEARRGKKDESKEAKNIVTAKNLTQRITVVTEMLEGATDEKRKAEIKDQLARRIKYTREKIDAGLVDFGESKDSLMSQLKLVESLGVAAVTAESLDTKEKDVDQRLERYLGFKERKISAAQKKFIRKNMIKGALFGIFAAEAGYWVREAAHQFGWFGGNSEKTVEGIKKIKDAAGQPPRLEGGTVFAPEQKVGSVSVPDSLAVEQNEIPIELQGVPPETPATETAQAAHAAELLSLDEHSIVKAGKGIEHVFRRQIENDLEIAKALGYEGDGSAESLKRFSGNAAHELAKKFGYVDGLKEVRVGGPGGEVAYDLELDKEKGIRVFEKIVKDGRVVESHEAGTPFETDTEKYEYIHNNKAPEASGRAADHVRADALRDKLVGKIDHQVGTTNTVDPTHGAEELKIKTPEVAQQTAPEDMLGNQPGGRSGRFTGLPPDGADQAAWQNWMRMTETPYAGRSGRFTGLPPNAFPPQIFPGQNAVGIMEGALNTLTEAKIEHINHLLEVKNADVFFGETEEVEKMWQSVSSESAQDYLGKSLSSVDQKYRMFAMYLRELRDESGVIPKGRSLFSWKPESTAEYIARAREVLERKLGGAR